MLDMGDETLFFQKEDRKKSRVIYLFSGNIEEERYIRNSYETQENNHGRDYNDLSKKNSIRLFYHRVVSEM